MYNIYTQSLRGTTGLNIFSLSLLFHRAENRTPTTKFLNTQVDKELNKTPWYDKEFFTFFFISENLSSALVFLFNFIQYNINEAAKDIHYLKQLFQD